MKKILLLLCTACCLPAFVPPPKPSQGRSLPTFGQMLTQAEEEQKIRFAREEEERQQKMREEKQLQLKIQNEEELKKLRTLKPGQGFESLPAELRREILNINAQFKGILNINALANGILGLAGTNRTLRAQINNLPNMLAILNSLPKSAATYLVEKLAQLPVIQENMLEILQTLPRHRVVFLSHVLRGNPGIHQNKVQEWLKTIKQESGQKLLEAVEDENPNINTIARLLKNPNIIVDWKDRTGATALTLASTKRNTEIVKLLIDAGADVNEKSNFGYPSFANAIHSGNTEIIKLYLNAGANVNIRDNKRQTPLMLAIFEDAPNLAIIKLLLDSGADVRAANVYRQTALNHARKSGHFAIVKLLEDAEKEQKEKTVGK